MSKCCLTPLLTFSLFSGCDFCNVKYSFIGKAETLGRDLWEMVKMNGWDGLFNSPEDVTFHENATRMEKNRTVKYMAQLDADTKRKLIQMFKPDFVLFDYDVPEYMEAHEW